MLTIVHAIYKERIYTLNDYVTVERWLDGRGHILARELGVESGVELVLAIHEAVKRGEVALPHRVLFRYE